MLVSTIAAVFALPCLVYSSKFTGYFEENVDIPYGITIPPGMSALDAITVSLNSQIMEPRVTWSVEDVQNVMQFRLFTRSNPEEPEMIYFNQSTPLNYFQPEKATKIYIHGWSSGKSVGSAFREAYLSSNYTDVNFIEMLWGEASSLYYGFFRSRVTAIGQTLSQILDNLVENDGMDLSTVHVLGYSAGAHIAGEAGRYVTKGFLGRITGLDPAGPLFSEENTSDRLSPDTAMLVDVIHTCSNQLGLAQPMGHVDFYPNRGTAIQPGCMVLDYLLGMCSHRRAVNFYLESITSAIPFTAWHCDDGEYGEVVMGEYLDKKSRGSFCLETASAPPFAMKRSLETNTIIR